MISFTLSIFNWLIDQNNLSLLLHHFRKYSNNQTAFQLFYVVSVSNIFLFSSDQPKTIFRNVSNQNWSLNDLMHTFDHQLINILNRPFIFYICFINTSFCSSSYWRNDILSTQVNVVVSNFLIINWLSKLTLWCYFFRIGFSYFS